MSDPRSNSSSNSGVGGIDSESGLGQGEWAGTGGDDWGGRRGENPYCSCPEAKMLSQLKDELGAWFTAAK
ncbi:hypothetical protein L3Q82_002841 [Scortum barcoo]|uniref:Uncharacterized protein n=1 Tax=Scortum barcoo TaxID=214431 RepID=A0ACB8VV23_9TELE|nr:hypothetical protein L3Q82_002841 [Scortum barcoo]